MFLFDIPNSFHLLQELTEKKALKIYSKAVPDATFVDIENKMRQDNLNFYLIAMVSSANDYYFSPFLSTNCENRKSQLVTVSV